MQVPAKPIKVLARPARDVEMKFLQIDATLKK
jgi:hypothetical protein